MDFSYHIPTEMASTSLVYSTLIILILLVHPAFRSCVARKPHLPTKKPQHDNRILQEPLMKSINSNARAGWKAEMSPRFANYTIAEFKRILGSKPLPGGDPIGLPVVTHTQALLDLPESFDARTAWPQCSTISGILDQGHCGSCWAFGAVEALSDRFCVHFGKNISLSVNDLLSCCGELCGDGCDGGSPAAAWRYLVNTGVVTQQCDSYFDTKGCTHPGCEPIYPTPTCSTKCAIQTMGWQSSKHFAANGYKVSSDPYSIMAEVFTNGPVQISFTIYRDFVHYKSGVYKHIVGAALGGHAVKLIGWGTSDSGEDYWILANQWNKSWGEDGFFRVTRGTNECGIEEDVVAGLPADKHLS